MRYRRATHRTVAMNIHTHTYTSQEPINQSGILQGRITSARHPDEFVAFSSSAAFFSFFSARINGGPTDSFFVRVLGDIIARFKSSFT